MPKPFGPQCGGPCLSAFRVATSDEILDAGPADRLRAFRRHTDKFHFAGVALLRIADDYPAATTRGRSQIGKLLATRYTRWSRESRWRRRSAYWPARSGSFCRAAPARG